MECKVDFMVRNIEASDANAVGETGLSRQFQRV